MTPRVTETYELSPIQAGMLFNALSHPGQGVDIEQIVIAMPGAVDVAMLSGAWRVALGRHPILRSALRWEDCPQPMQDVYEGVELPVQQLDWSDRSPAEQKADLEAFIVADRALDLDLARAPLMRLACIGLGAAGTVLVWTFHHCLLDGRSFPPVLQEVFDLYEAGGDETKARAPARRPFRDHVEWLRGLDVAASERFWKERLAGFTAPVRLWVQRAATGLAAGEAPFGAVERYCSRETTEQSSRAARACSVTLNTLLQGAWAMLLSRLSGEQDIVFGATRACRRSGLVDADEMIGILINTLPLRVDADPLAELASWLRGLREQGVAVREHEHSPLAKVQAWSSVERGLPLFDSIVVYEHLPLEGQLHALGGQWLQRSVRYIGQTNFPLALIAYGGERLLLRIEHSRAHFDDETAQRMLGYLETLLSEMVRLMLAPAKAPVRLADVGMLPAAERAALISEGKARIDETLPVSTLHGQFEAQARRTPDAIAVSCGAERLSYRQLNARANRIAHALRAAGIGRGDLVGLSVERTADIAVGILAILKAGGAYLPLDPDYPRDRLGFMVEDAKVRVVLGSGQHEAPGAARLIDIAAAGAAGPEHDPEPLATPEDLAYVIYTSGSTGKPKGALVTHANVSRLFTATEHWFDFAPQDVWTLFHSYAFDFSVWELWGALLYGGRVVVVPYWVSRDPAAFRQLLIDERVTMLSQTPSAFRQLVQADLIEAPADYALRGVVFGGEALELHALKPWLERYGDGAHRDPTEGRSAAPGRNGPRLINMYGITETTVHVTYRPITMADVEAGRGSVIGEPIPDLYIRLLDQRGEPVPAGVPGEIWVGGAGVARGYLERPELTAQRFMPDPFDASGKARLYRAGDLARRLPDGDLEFMGRIDAQVKIRGFRIELGEIEAALAACPGVGDVAVIAREDTPGDKRLVAYVVGRDDAAPGADELRRALSAVLPEHMVPAHFIALPALPLNANGKLDRKALPAPSAGAAADVATRPYVEPRTETERTMSQVWAEVLRLERVGTADHFFELGGDSILSIQVVARCRRAGLTGFSTRDLFERPTIAELARLVATEQDAVVVRDVEIAGPPPLTPIQRWFFEQRLAEPNYWNQAFLLEVPATFDTDTLERALAVVAARHEALRTHYRITNGEVIPQVVAAAAPLRVQRFDVSGSSATEQAAQIEAHAIAVQGSLDLERGPLLAAAHFDLGAGVPGRLLLALHHLAVDGVSWRILIEDIEAAYNCLLEGRPVDLGAATTTFGRWAHQLSQHARDARVCETLAAWQSIVAAPAVAIPMMAADSLEREASTIAVELTADETTALLRDVPPVYRTQINDALLTALALALRDATAGTSFLIDMEGHGREDIGGGLDLSRTIGWFTSLFPMRLDVPKVGGVADALKAIKEQARRVPDRGLSFGLLRYLGRDAESGALSARQPAQILFNYLGQLDQITAGSKLFAFAPEPTGPWHAAQGRRTHAIEVLAQVRNGRLRIEWISSETQIALAQIERLAQGFVAALRSIIAHCRMNDAGGRTPSDVPLAALDQVSLDHLWQRYPRFEDVYPLTPMQRLFLVMEEVKNAVGLEQWQFRIDGELAPSLLRQAFEQVLARHAILRTAFVSPPGGEPMQVVAPNAVLPWQEHDLTSLASETREETVRRILREDAQAGLDITRPPLMRVNLARVGAAQWLMVWTTHHLCIDGWSWPLLFKEVAEVYASLEDQRAPALQPATRYGDYVAWLARRAEPSESYWKRTLAGLAGPTPFALAPPAARSASRLTETAMEIRAETTRALEQFARSNQSTSSTLVQAAWAFVLAHYSGMTDVVLGASFSGRPAEVDGIETMIGPCVTNVPVRVSFAADEPLRNLLSRLQRQQLDIEQHQFTPLDGIQAASGVPWHSRLFDSLVVFQNYSVDASMGRLGRSARLVPVYSPEATTYPLTIAVSPGEMLRFRLIHDAAKLGAETVNAIVADLTAVLEGIAKAAPDETAGGILEVLPAERRGKAGAIFRAAGATIRRSGPLAPPRTDMERRIAALWRGLLGQAEIGIDDNFFDAGGQSILLLRLHRSLERELKQKLSVVALLQFPTIRGLAAHLVGEASGTPAAQQSADAAAERARKQREALGRQRIRARPV